MKKALTVALLAIAIASPALAQSGSGGDTNRQDAMLNNNSFMAQFYVDEAQTKLQDGGKFKETVQRLSAGDRDILRDECRESNSMRATFCTSLKMSVEGF